LLLIYPGFLTGISVAKLLFQQAVGEQGKKTYEEMSFDAVFIL
jgi:hypothetical protein